MARYQIYAKLVVDIDTPRTPAQLKNALTVTSPTLRAALKAAWRSQLQKDATGQTRATDFYFRVCAVDLATGLDIDLGDGGAYHEVEPA